MSSIPALAGDSEEAPLYEMDGYIVTFYIIGPDMTVLEADGRGNVSNYL